ncbi:MAG: MmcQ/YjbR family DNA-binding protein [Pseudonocardiales bacterium]|nr:MmcQ/YjbR family DNA-binding protein [Pseudonocardiales bacterium]
MRNLERLRTICLALPEAQERETWGEPTMRVRDKIFAFPREDQVTFKADPDERVSLLGDPRFFLPPYVGGKGWVGLRLQSVGEASKPDWDEVAELIATSYRLIAPKRLGALLDQPRKA